MKKKILLIVLIAVAILLASAITLVLVFRDAIFTVESTEHYTFINPDETKADTDPGMTVDGVFDESIYSQNTWTFLHNANGGNTVDIAMTSWFGDKGIYVAYEVRENTPIYVNMDRATWMNSCIEMYLVPSYVQKMPSEDVFEIDLLPNGYLLFKRPNAAGGWSDVSTTHDKMAYLGATTIGGEINTDDCTGYNLELFIPYDYLSYLGVDAQILKNGYVHINPSHITSYNETGTDGSVDRFWYSFGQQLGGDGWNDINRYFKFDQNGAMGTVKNITKPGVNCTITANPTAIPGLETSVTVTPDAGYALTSVCCNETEYISSVNYREDGSVKLTVRAGNEDLTFTAQAEPVTEGNKRLQGKVQLRNILTDTYEGVTASYEDASGEHKLELSNDGSFDLGQLSQGMYTIRVKKNGYVKTERTICLNRDMDILVKLDYDLFETESGNCWKLEDANEGLLTKINGTGAILSKEALSDFYVEANFSYSQTLAKEAIGDDYQQQRMGLRVKFEDGKYWHIDLLKQNDGTYCLQYGKILGKNSLYNWDIVHTLSPDQIARYESDTGIKLGLLRLGKTAYLYLDNWLVATTQLPNEQAGAKAQVGFESFVSNAEIMKIPYRLCVKDLNRVELVDQGSEGATVSLKGQCTLGQDAVLQIVPTTTGKLLSLQVNGVEMAHLAKTQSAGYQLTIPNNREKILSVKVIYGTPERTTAVIDLQDSNASGFSVRLVQDGAVRSTAVAADGKAVFQNVDTGVYQVQVQIFEVWTSLQWVTILDDETVTVDVKTLFETPENSNYTGTVKFSGVSSKNYSIATELTGEAWFTMQLQVDGAQLQKVAANRGNVRLGYRLFFGGDKGNYQWDNEYEITLKYTQEGTWVFEQMNTWVSYPVPQELVDALTHKGLYLALHRNGNNGILTLYCGATKEQLLSGTHAYRWDTATHKQLKPIMRFGVGFWSEKGSSYQATVTDLSYGTSLPGLVMLTDVPMTLELLEHKTGAYHSLPAGTPVKLKSVTQEYSFTTNAQGKILGKVLPGTYTVTVLGYADRVLEVPRNGVAGQLVLEYPFFEIPTGWDAEKHDLSKVNDLTPVIGMTGGTMNVLTKDTYQDVSASILVKAANSLHSAHTQGIWVRFEDGKYMVLYQEDEKLLFADRLWDFETVTGQKQQVATLSAQTMDRWDTGGYWLTLSRKGNILYVTADGQQYQAIQLPAKYEKHKVQVGYFAYDSAPGASWQFAISKELPPINEDVVIRANVTVEDGTSIRLQKDGQVYTATFAQNQVTFQNLSNGKYQVQIQVFGYWADLGDVEITTGARMQLDVESLFEKAVDFDGNLHLSGTQNQHVSVAAEITGDAWFMMQMQVPKAQLDAVAANRGNVRLGYRLFFGGDKGNYQWDNEYEITLKYTQEGTWVFEQMNTWVSYPVPQELVDALTGDGLYLALHRDGKTGVLTMYYGATIEELISGSNSWKWTTAAQKQKETITRFGVGFWSENGSDYTANVTNLRYGTSLADMVEAVNVQLTANADVPVRLTQNGQQKAVGTFCDGKAELLVSQMGNYRVEVQIFNAWCPVTTIAADGEKTIDVDVLSVFEDRDFTDLDGNISFTGTQNKHCSVATEIAADAWFAMKVQVPKAQLDAVAANRGNVRLGYRLFFGGESGNYQWENEYEITLKYTQNGWIMEQMNTWEGWDRTLPQAMVDALTGDGLYLALHRNRQTGVLTMYYGATPAELVAGEHYFAYTQATAKHKEMITRFGAGFWSENGSDYTALITGLRYGTTLDEALGG